VFVLLEVVEVDDSEAVVLVLLAVAEVDEAETVVFVLLEVVEVDDAEVVVLVVVGDVDTVAEEDEEALEVFELVVEVGTTELVGVVEEVEVGETVVDVDLPLDNATYATVPATTTITITTIANTAVANPRLRLTIKLC